MRETARIARKAAKDKNRDGKAKAANVMEDEEHGDDVFGSYSAVIVDDDSMPELEGEESDDEGDHPAIPASRVSVNESYEHMLAFLAASTVETGD